MMIIIIISYYIIIISRRLVPLHLKLPMGSACQKNLVKELLTEAQSVANGSPVINVPWCEVFSMG